MKTTEGLRNHARFAISWPVMYGNEELFGQGTVLNISQAGCQIAGTMPVAVGMLVKLWMSPPHREEQLCIEEARVLWVKDYEFGLELRRLPSSDQRQLMGFLERAERRNSFQRLHQSSDKNDVAAMPLALPVEN